MIVLYSLVLVLLAMVQWLVARRAQRLARRYSHLAFEVWRLAQELTQRPGNRQLLDPCRLAQGQYRLARLAEKRDRLEARQLAWQERAERLGRLLAALRTWKGRALPYTCGLLDLSLVLYLLDQLGMLAGLRWEQVWSWLLRVMHGG